MKRRDRIKGLYSVPPDQLAAANSDDQPRTLAGPVRSMGLALDQMESESQALREALAAGNAVVEVEPDRIAGSFVRDRLPELDADFASFQQSIAENGQEVPILVRPHPDQAGRFQIAFGHRRHRACLSLGIKVKAIIRELSDRDLILAQGVENAQRKDLSYIERALYASRLEDRGFERTVICDALATEKGELSKLITVASKVPEDLVAVIGPAPKTGRRRWLALVEALGRAEGRKAAQQAAKDPDLERADSDTRFIRIFAAAASPASRAPKQTIWTSEGKPSASLLRTTRSVSLAFEAHVEPEFAEYVASRLDELYASFQSQAKA